MLKLTTATLLACTSILSALEPSWGCITETVLSTMSFWRQFWCMILQSLRKINSVLPSTLKAIFLPSFCNLPNITNTVHLPSDNICPEMNTTAFAAKGIISTCIPSSNALTEATCQHGHSLHQKKNQTERNLSWFSEHDFFHGKKVSRKKSEHQLWVLL